MISWGTIKSLLLFLGPMLLPKAIAYYRSVRSRPSLDVPIRSPSPAAQRALTLLTITCIVALINTLPYFAPPEIFSQTQSRLQIPTDTLFNRLASLSNPPGLSESQTILRQHLSSLESRVLYFKYGPDVLTYCKFCNPEDPNSYLYYAIPSILAPHLLHLGILALSTSGVFAGTDGRKWRTPATYTGIAVCIAELWITASYKYTDNKSATRLSDIDLFFWRMRVYRSLAISATSAALGYLIFLTSTNRAFVEPPPAAMRVENAIRQLDSARRKLSAMTIVRNSVVRDRNLRTLQDEYWLQEAQIKAEMMEDREVREGIQNALRERIDTEKISSDADLYFQTLFGQIEAEGRKLDAE